jgi:hypothetical protein
MVMAHPSNAFVARDPIIIFHCLEAGPCRRRVDARTTHVQASMVGAGWVICYIRTEPALTGIN